MPIIFRRGLMVAEIASSGWKLYNQKTLRLTISLSITFDIGLNGRVYFEPAPWGFGCNAQYLAHAHHCHEMRRWDWFPAPRGRPSIVYRDNQSAILLEKRSDFEEHAYSTCKHSLFPRDGYGEVERGRGQVLLDWWNVIGYLHQTTTRTSILYVPKRSAQHVRLTIGQPPRCDGGPKECVEDIWSILTMTTKSLMILGIEIWRMKLPAPVRCRFLEAQGHPVNDYAPNCK